MSVDAVDSDDETSAAETSASDRDRRRSGGGWLRRAGTAALGGALLAAGIKRRSLGGAALALVGGWLSARAVWGFVRPDREPGASVDPDESGVPAGSLTVDQSVTVGKSTDELSELLRDAENLDRIAGPFAEVSSAGEDRQRWTVTGPLDRSLSWETQVAEDDADEELRWESVGGTTPFEEFSVDFSPASGDRGTAATLRLHLDPPGGPLGRAALERLDVVPESLGGTVLDRFKSLAETGEVPTTERNPSARGKGDLV